MNNSLTPSDDPEDITKKVLVTIAKRVGVGQDSIDLKDHLFHDLNASKLEKAEIIASLENAYHITFDTTQLSNLNTPGDIIEYITDNVE